MDIRIYVMTHKLYTKPYDLADCDGLFQTLHVGRAISDDIGYPGDDFGDNISDRNTSWCELTGIYWVWKNIDCNIVGICHYRRYFVENEDFIHRGRIEEILKENQVIVSRSESTEYASLWEHFSKVHYRRDMEICRQVLEEKHPEYIPAFELCMNGNLFTVGNMMITSKKIFDEYCTWLFDILFETEKRINVSEYDAFQSRVMGYLSERLLRVWLLYNRYKVYELEVRLIDPVDRDNQIKAVAFTRRTISLFLKDLTINYRNGNFIELVDSTPLCNDFHGKIPVWINWWQGESAMPEIVQVCCNSIAINIPQDICEIHLISFDNVGEYVSFPSWIIDKYQKGIISLNELSDILCMGLLLRYGGLWIDSSFLLAKPLEKHFFECSLYTYRIKKEQWSTDISHGRWSNKLWYSAKPGYVLFRYALNAFYMYWFTQDTPAVYYLSDYIIDTAYSDIQNVCNSIDSIPYSHPDTTKLAPKLDFPYDEADYEQLVSNTYLFKTSADLNLAKETITGRKTIYGYLFDKFTKKILTF